MKKIFIIKIGSSVLLTNRGKLDEFRVAHLVEQIDNLRNTGIDIILITSGAVGCGFSFLKSSNNDLVKQGAAGIGQALLISMFNTMFLKKKLCIAQILLTRKDISLEDRRLNLCCLLRFYLRQGIIPILNENDVIELHSFGGNDFLAAEITQLLNADQLIILSTMKGSKYGVGGGEAKQQAVEIVSKCNIITTILNGKTKNILLEGI